MYRLTILAGGVVSLLYLGSGVTVLRPTMALGGVFKGSGGRETTQPQRPHEFFPWTLQILRFLGPKVPEPAEQFEACVFDVPQIVLLYEPDPTVGTVDDARL
jgi:hypothetical protein